MKDSLLEKVMWFCVFIILGGVALFIYWLFQPVDIIKSKSPFPLVKKEYKKGEILEYISDYCKYTDQIPIQVKRQLIDGYAYDLPVSTNTNFPKGCGNIHVPVPLYIPMIIPAGKYHIRVYATYQINPLKTYTYVWDTEEFELK